MEAIWNFIEQTGFYMLINGFLADGGWKYLVMICVSLLLLWLAIKKQFEPLLLIGIAFGMLLTNLPGAGLYNEALWSEFMTEGSKYYHDYGYILANGGLWSYNRCTIF